MAKTDMLMVYPNPSEDSPVKLTPLSILYPGAMFEAEGKRVEYWDERWDSPEEFDSLCHASSEVGISAFTGTQAGRASALISRVKLLNPKIVVGVGGHHARTCPDQVRREQQVDRIWPLSSYGEDLPIYSTRTRHLFARGDMQYSTSRGCPYGCTFCCLHEPWQPKDLTVVGKELQTIHEDIGFKTISFSDPNIVGGVEKENGQTAGTNRATRIREIGDILRPLEVRWDGNIRADYITGEMVDALVYSQCYSLELGCESGNDRYLKHVLKKGHGVEAIRTACRNLAGSGISTMYSFIHGAPYETRQAFADTMELIDWIAQTDKTARISVYEYAPYPGTSLYADAITGRVAPGFIAPTTMAGWGKFRLMRSPVYWIAGLTFRPDNVARNFPGGRDGAIAPYVERARRQWAARDIDDFPVEEVEALVKGGIALGRAAGVP